MTMSHLGASATALHALTLVQAASLVREGSLKSEDYAAALLQRCRDGALLNAFIHVDEQALLAAAREADLARAAGRSLGQLHGIPLAVNKRSRSRPDEPSRQCRPATPPRS